MSKKNQTMNFVNANPGLLACPICKGQMQACDSYVVTCPNRHSFDVSSSGYINLLTSAAKSEYGMDMLESRNKVCISGFFDGLMAEINSIILEYATPSAAILDAGCGEGSQLAKLCELTAASAGHHPAAVGVDISKEGIRIASRDYPGKLWLVADLSRLPLTDGSIDIILNILSPSNYAEFDRVLKENGILIKVVPCEHYLKELRQALYLGENKERYSNDMVVSLFERSYQGVERRHIQQSFEIPQGLWPHIVAMTPLAWGAKNIKAVIENPLGAITLDFFILTGRKRIKGQGSV